METDDTDVHRRALILPAVMMSTRYPPPHFGRYLQEESGAGKLESLRSRFRLSLSTSERADVLEGGEEMGAFVRRLRRRWAR